MKRPRVSFVLFNIIYILMSGFNKEIFKFNYDFLGEQRVSIEEIPSWCVKFDGSSIGNEKQGKTH